MKEIVQHTIFFQEFIRCVGKCSNAIKLSDRLCSSNSSCILRLFYPCYNKSACANSSCTGTCTGEWVRARMGQCPVFCDGGNRTVQYECRDQSKKFFCLLKLKIYLRRKQILKIRSHTNKMSLLESRSKALTHYFLRKIKKLCLKVLNFKIYPH